MSAGGASGRWARLVPRHVIVRRLAIATLVNTFGNGLFFATSAVYFTRVVGLSASQVGIGLTLAGTVGTIATIPIGQLADRHESRRLLVALAVVEAVAVLGYLLAGSFAVFLLVAAVVSILTLGSTAVRSTLIAVALPPEERVAGRAYLRSVTNVGMGAGAALAAIALHVDSPAGYRALVVANAVTYLLTAAVLRRMPDGRPADDDQAAGPTRRLVAVRDRPYVLVTALCAVFPLQFGLLDVGLPLWIVGHTDAPRISVAAMLVVNTVLVTIFQVRAGRAAVGLDRAAVACRRSGLLLAAACALYGLASGLPAGAAVALLLVGAIIQTGGEVLSAAGTWELSYGLAGIRTPGAYQGVFTAGFAAGLTFAPLAVTQTALRFGAPGWLLLAGAFAASGVVLVPVARWAAGARHGRGRVGTTATAEA